MSFIQFKLTKSINQERGIFDKYIYSSVTDTIAEVSTAGYFDESRFIGEWDKSIIECLCVDGYFIGKISTVGNSVSVLITSSGSGGQKSGFFDYNDLATATTPLVVTGGGAAVILTNDELGSFTNKLYPPDNVTDVWDASSTLFDFSELTLGSKVEYRVDVDLTISGANAEVELEIELGIGLGAYTLSVGSRFFKTAGTYNVTTNNFLYIGDTNTKNGGGRFKISSSNNMDVKVNGWVCYLSIY